MTISTVLLMTLPFCYNYFEKKKVIYDTTMGFQL